MHIYLSKGLIWAQRKNGQKPSVSEGWTKRTRLHGYQFLLPHKTPNRISASLVHKLDLLPASISKPLPIARGSFSRDLCLFPPPARCQHRSLPFWWVYPLTPERQSQRRFMTGISPVVEWGSARNGEVGEGTVVCTEKILGLETSTWAVLPYLPINVALDRSVNLSGPHYSKL